MVEPIYMAGAGYESIGALASNVLYNVHLNKKEHVFFESREYWQKAHSSGLA